MPSGAQPSGAAAFHGLGDGPLKRANLERVGQVADFRELRRKVAVDKDEPAARARHAKVFDLCGLYGNAAFGCALKRSLCQSREICEAPILVVSGGESFGVETLPRVFAQLAQPQRVALLPLGGQFAIRFEICVQLSSYRRHCVLVFRVFRCYAHARCCAHARKAAGTLASAAPYPVSSSSRASSGPPERTIFPSTRTCTKSGVM